MSDHQPPHATGQISPDGQFQWNGTAWVPNPHLPQPKKKHTVRNVLLIMIVVFVAGIAGCLALIGGAANEIDKAIKEDDARAAQDVTLGACPVKAEFGSHAARLTITNSNKAAQTYTGTVYLNKGGEQVGSGVILEDVQGGATVKVTVNLYSAGSVELTTDQVKGATCTLRKVGAFETE
ncbi:hypothetical protein EFK50_07595 [Nocardioides marmoriginsengisoli]|uniref:DUF2510 domain-containing protein n=1 Tax=Nocardioides marmoriginsengisoli TaxID=661483 RepID=A0A3N0CM37_9ACTN|nr:hypothetical protein [Nocardioides marmoriginsengisoli]RNL64379.1 hypothetical protein EFK50_07595 [Nocardioides marmoriginsengisoli]